MTPLRRVFQSRLTVVNNIPVLRSSILQLQLFSFSFEESNWGEQLLWSQGKPIWLSSIVSEQAKSPQESPCGLGLLIYKLPLPLGSNG